MYQKTSLSGTGLPPYHDQGLVAEAIKVFLVIDDVKPQALVVQQPEHQVVPGPRWDLQHRLSASYLVPAFVAHSPRCLSDLEKWERVEVRHTHDSK